MSYTEIFEEAQKNMQNSRLLQIVEHQISKLAQTGGRSHTMTVPPRVDDTDMILSEMVKRFKEMESQLTTTNKELEKVRGMYEFESARRKRHVSSMNRLRKQKNKKQNTIDQLRSQLKQSEAERNELKKFVSRVANIKSIRSEDTDFLQGQAQQLLNS